MQFKPVIVSLLLAFLTTPAQSIPWPFPPENEHGSLNRRQTLTVDVDATDTVINFGSVTPADVFAKLVDNCSEVGCSGEKHLDVDTTIVDGTGHLQNMQVTVSAEGSFNREKTATREALVEVAKAIAGQMTTQTDDTYVDPTCEPFCDHYPTMTQYYFTQQLHMATLEDGGDDAFLLIYVTINNPSDHGFCSKLLGGAAAVGGAISGVVGGVFGLGALICPAS